MKKALILAMALTLVLTGSLFAQGRRLVAEPNATFTPGQNIGGTLVATTAPTTTNNDDSCDIGTTPAATLLLPYFRVNETDINTVFTVVNTSDRAQVAHVTVWTDWSFPVLDFNIYLTGYDVQGISLRDVIFNGVIAPTATTGVAGTTDTGALATSNTNGTGLSPYGTLSDRPTNRAVGGAGANPNFALGGPGCANLPGNIGPLAQAVRTALINGTYVIPGIVESCSAAQRVGSTAGTDPFHPAGTAVGYITIDVADECTLALPTDPDYYAEDILFDNVLTGDYETFDYSAASNYAGGTPLVHIRAIPEGGPAGFTPVAGVADTNLPYTFYSRYQDPLRPVRDRRQPLPALFAARYTQGGGLSTSYNIWREGYTDFTNSDCAGVVANSALTIAEIVRFDEHENWNTFQGQGGVSPSTPTGSRTNEAARVPVSSTVFPPHPGVAGDVGGWMYLNLDNGDAPGGINPLFPLVGGAPGYGTLNRRPSQNWVVISMTGTGVSAGALSVDFDATWLGNGCTPVTGQTPANSGTTVLGPAPNYNPPCPAGDCDPLN